MATDSPQIETVDASARDGVTIVVPTYNEEGGVTATLDALLETLAGLEGIAWEVVVVDDGSSDGTSAALAPFADRVTIIRHPVNRGYGAAIKSGVKISNYGWVMLTDADGTYPDSFIPELLAGRDGHTMVVGARIGQAASIPLIRRPPKWVLRKLAEVLSRKKIPDLNSGLRVMRKDLLVQFENILPDGFSYTTTITLSMFSAGHSVNYVPIDYRKRTGASKIRPIRDTLTFLQLIIRTIMFFDPLRVFLPSALLFMGVGVALGGANLYFAAHYDVTGLLLFLTGVHLLAIGMLADTLNRRMS